MKQEKMTTFKSHLGANQIEKKKVKCQFLFKIPYIFICNSDFRKRWRDVISQHPGHSHGYKSVMAAFMALLKANLRYILFAQMTQNAQVCYVTRKDCFQDAYILNLEGKYRE